jgi:hypothetical protein
MKLALLGADVESLRLAEAAVAAGHEIVWQADSGVEDPAASWAGPHAAGGPWEALLDPQTADAVIIGHGPGGDELRAHQVQELARLDRPMLVTFPLFSSVLTYFEVDMARTESGAIVQHFNPLTESPALADAADWVAEGHPDLGPVEQVLCTRTLADRSRELVLWHFARDVEMLGVVAGRLNRIGAHAGAGDEAAYAALSVQLLGTGEVPVRWSVEPPPSGEGLSLTLVCQLGRVTLEFDSTGRLVNPASDELVMESTAIDRFIAAVETSDSAASTWLDALHAMELTDSIEISLRRGRMIDVHHQQLTEHLAFKGTMAAAGCGLLFFLVPLVLAISWLAGKFGVPIGQFVPHILLGLLAIFLGLQFLPKLLYREPPAKS